MKCHLTRRSIEFLNRFLKTKVEVPNFNNLQRLLFDIIFRNSTISRIDYSIWWWNGQIIILSKIVIKRLFCQRNYIENSCSTNQANGTWIKNQDVKKRNTETLKKIFLLASYTFCWGIIRLCRWFPFKLDCC